jgi:D-glycero-D-manno-heptose 1,7-bisphosphate phosphatase
LYRRLKQGAVIRLILLDRDGVINHDSPDFIKSVAEFKAIDGSLEAIVQLCQAGFKIGVCSNQSGVGRGLLTIETLEKIHQQLLSTLASMGGQIHSLSYCPHLPDDECVCRKPLPGMLNEIMDQFNESPQTTLFVGDSLRDLQAARAAGCEPVLVRTGNGRSAEVEAVRIGVTRIYDDLASFATDEAGRRQAAQAAQQ